MVKLNRIYTRTGDNGTTGLVGGARIDKAAQRVCAYGDIDELNAHVGKAAFLAEKSGRSEIASKLVVIQNELFDLGAELATPPGAEWSNMALVTPELIARL
jgi:cob(I)alamin adenosyltransferase